MARPRILLDGLAFGESPRWHQGRLWLCNWGTQEVIALGPDGAAEVITRIPTTLPYSIDWLPDGRMLAVSGPEALVLRREPDGSLVTHADLSAIAGVFNEIVVDGRGNAYVNGTVLVLVMPDGTARPVASGLEFGNGMAVTPDNSTLIVAESHGNRLAVTQSPGSPAAGPAPDAGPPGVLVFSLVSYLARLAMAVRAWSLLRGRHLPAPGKETAGSSRAAAAQMPVVERG